MEDDRRNQLYQDCTATYLHGLLQSVVTLGGGDLKMPSFVEILYPEVATQDVRTGAEIANDIRDRLLILAGKEGEDGLIQSGRNADP